MGKSRNLVCEQKNLQVRENGLFKDISAVGLFVRRWGEFSESPVSPRAPTFTNVAFFRAVVRWMTYSHDSGLCEQLTTVSLILAVPAFLIVRSPSSKPRTLSHYVPGSVAGL